MSTSSAAETAGADEPWRGRPVARLIGRVLALVAAFLALLICGSGLLHGQSARRVATSPSRLLAPLPCR
jgi:hypothetical protein